MPRFGMQRLPLILELAGAKPAEPQESQLSHQTLTSEPPTPRPGSRWVPCYPFSMLHKGNMDLSQLLEMCCCHQIQHELIFVMNNTFLSFNIYCVLCSNANYILFRRYWLSLHSVSIHTLAFQLFWNLGHTLSYIFFLDLIAFFKNLYGDWKFYFHNLSFRQDKRFFYLNSKYILTLFFSLSFNFCVIFFYINSPVQ